MALSDFENELSRHGKRVREHIKPAIEFDNLTEIPKRKSKRYLKRTIVLVAACIAVIGVSSATTAFKVWDERLTGFFGAGGQKLNDTEQAYEIPMAAQTVNGVTVTVIQTIFDENNTYVLYEVNLPDYITGDESYKFNGWGLDLPYAKDEQDTISTMTNTLISCEEHTMSFITQETRVNSTESKMLTLNLSDFGYEEFEDGAYIGFHTLVEGDWSITWQSDLAGAGKTFEPDTPILFDDMTELETLTVSPFSVTAKINGNDILGSVRIKICLKSGENITCEMSDENPSGSSYIYTGGVNFLYCRFKSVINPDDIEKVFVNDVEIKM